MTPHFYRAANPLWYIPCDGGLLLLTVLAFWPSVISYGALGVVGAFLKYMAYRQHTLLVWIFWVAMGLHVFEAIVALRICQRLQMDSTTAMRWFRQTLLLGYPSLGMLKQHEAERRRE